MNKVDVKIVVGSNYGDECKGLATHYFSQQAKSQNKSCLNVLYNGGCQRGHTVELKNGSRHVFHHFGSGTYDNAHTYFDKDFIINPIMFMDEYEALCSERVIPICFISPECRVSTPYDMIINQTIERARGKNRHGSCGLGIFETQQRYKQSCYNMNFKDMINHTDIELKAYLKKISVLYVKERMRYYGVSEIPKDVAEILNSDILIENYINDLRNMAKITHICDYPYLFKNYDVIIFEGAQGLELDESNDKAMPHITASSTTSFVPVKRCGGFETDIEICYITRSYFTRHGAGILPKECAKAYINPDIQDRTNIDNEFQESIRYGVFAQKEFFDRVNKDKTNSLGLNNSLKTSIFVSHLNYTDGEIFGDCTLKFLISKFNNKYLSYSKYAEDVQVKE